MKNIIKSLIGVLLVLAFSSCKKDENKDFYQGGTPPVLSATPTGNIPLAIAAKNNNIITFNWTNPNYNFSTGVSSQNVNYTLQFDTVGANFTSPGLQEVSISKDLSYTMTVGQVNAVMGKMSLNFDQKHNMQVRIKSSLGMNSAVIYSNSINFSATNYLDVVVPLPASGELYITGDALPSGWTNAPPPSQKFTRVSVAVFEITVPLLGGKSYTFLPVWNSWDYKYSIKTKNDPALVNGGDFQVGGEDILAPAASGNYKISVDFVKGKFTVTKL
ncbi:MAG: SusE domain-containing protein [Bacteroidetes bacterium]|nr:SusE domain-containing protein [Bacteroidota bacterium]